MSERGALALVLHTHMPYVEGFGTWPFGEEWLFEAMATVYLPLLALLERQAALGREGLMTVGLTPVLCDQLALPDVGERFTRFIEDVRLDGHRRQAGSFRQQRQQELACVIERSAAIYEGSLAFFNEKGGEVLACFDDLSRQGVVELWTSTATHSVLPLAATESYMALQLATGIASHRRRFTGWGGGLWLPECAYRPGLEELLARQGVAAFCLDQSLEGGGQKPLEPVATAAGPVAIPIDWPTVELVWGDGGYPAHGDYCDYHSLTENGQRAYKNSGGTYDPECAGRRAARDAQRFVQSAIERLDSYSLDRGRPGLLTFALDTELLGHWWHEGLIWLEAVIESACERGLELVTLPGGLEGTQPVERELVAASWGRGKGLSSWDNDRSAEMVWQARRAELDFLRTVRAAGPLKAGLGLERACRELLALQSSDWYYMVTYGTAADYPRERFESHLSAFKAALESAVSGCDGSGALDPALGGLAPYLSLEPLLAPPPQATLAVS